MHQCNKTDKSVYDAMIDIIIGTFIIKILKLDA